MFLTIVPGDVKRPAFRSCYLEVCDHGAWPGISPGHASRNCYIVHPAKFAQLIFVSRTAGAVLEPATVQPDTRPGEVHPPACNRVPRTRGQGKRLPSSSLVSLYLCLQTPYRGTRWQPAQHFPDGEIERRMHELRRDLRQRFQHETALVKRGVRYAEPGFAGHR